MKSLLVWQLLGKLLALSGQAYLVHSLGSGGYGTMSIAFSIMLMAASCSGSALNDQILRWLVRDQTATAIHLASAARWLNITIGLVVGTLACVIITWGSQPAMGWILLLFAPSFLLGSYQVLGSQQLLRQGRDAQLLAIQTGCAALRQVVMVALILVGLQWCALPLGVIACSIALSILLSRQPGGRGEPDGVPWAAWQPVAGSRRSPHLLMGEIRLGITSGLASSGVESALIPLAGLLLDTHAVGLISLAMLASCQVPGLVQGLLRVRAVPRLLRIPGAGVLDVPSTIGLGWLSLFAGAVALASTVGALVVVPIFGSGWAGTGSLILLLIPYALVDAFQPVLQGVALNRGVRRSFRLTLWLSGGSLLGAALGGLVGHETGFTLGLSLGSLGGLCLWLQRNPGLVRRAPV